MNAKKTKIKSKKLKSVSKTKKKTLKSRIKKNVTKKKASAKKKVKKAKSKKAVKSKESSLWVKIENKASTVEHKAEGELKLLTKANEFHIVAFVLALVVLSLILRSSSAILYAVISVAAIIFAHFLRYHQHKAHDVTTVIGIFFVPAAIVCAIYKDMFSFIILAFYLLSALIAIMLFYFHMKKHRCLDVMWSVTYSHVISLTFAFVAALLLSRFAMPNSFVSIPLVLLIFVLPILFVYFFFTKFFYLYFFDRKHIVKDTKKSVLHSLYGSFVLVFLLMLVYLVMAGVFFNASTESYNADLDEYIQDSFNIKGILNNQPVEMKELKVSKELLSLNEQFKSDVAKEKNLVAGQKASFGDVISDEYFSKMAVNKLDSIKFVVRGAMLIHIKSQINKYYLNVNAVMTSNVSQEEVDKVLDPRMKSVRDYIDANYKLYDMDEETKEMLDKLSDSKTNYGYFEENGFSFIFSTLVGKESLYTADDLVSSSFSNVIRHLYPFREMAAFTYRLVVFLDQAGVNSPEMENLYKNIDVNESKISKSIRYEIIKDHINSKKSRMAEQEKALTTLAS